MYFSLLGPIEVWQEGRLLPAGSSRERLILAIMLLNANKLTPMTKLIDAVWAESPRSAKAQLHNMICKLRRRLHAASDYLIVTRPMGYELRLHAHQLDLLEFRRLVSQAQLASSANHHELATVLFAKALSLWRGPALADLPQPHADLTRQTLHEEQLFAAEARLDSDLMLARHHEVLRDLAELIVDHPYRERLHEIKLLALIATGRRADALTTYREVYRLLTTDLGIEPGPILRALELQILRGNNTVARTGIDL